MTAWSMSQHLDAVRGQRREQLTRDAGTVLPGDGDQNGGQRLTRRTARWANPTPSPAGMFRWALASASSNGFQPRCGWASDRIRSIMYGWCSSNAGRSERIRGSEVKLCRGGGELVAHSSELP